jgi:mRNA-degrading endonuclease toxin of MazEF toxin-antitoxin module
VNVSALVSLDTSDLAEPVGALPATRMADVSRGSRLVVGV